MSDLVSFLIVILGPVVLVGVGVYLLFHKRKIVGNPQPPKWIYNLSAAAQNVHLNEFYKKTEQRYGWKWFLEYWRGERSAYSAWFTWLFAIPFIGVLCSAIVILVLNPSEASSLDALILTTFFVIFFIYDIFGAIILWKCARNSPVFFKYFARFTSVMIIINLLSSTLMKAVFMLDY